MSKILLTGSTGQVGSELIRALAPLGEVVIPDRKQCDLSRPELLRDLVDAVKPSVIVNAAAYTAVDQAEKEVALAYSVNATAPGQLAKAAKRHGALLVHYSTDYVFSGDQSEPYTEEDQPAPCSVYGHSKLSGEYSIRYSEADHLIFRTSWVYAAQGKNFLKTILRLAGEREELRIVADQIGAPTWARTIADATVKALQQELVLRQSGGFVSGIYNLTSSGATSWHGFASAIIAAARELHPALELKCKTVTPITTEQYPLPAARPANSRLAGIKLAQRYGIQMPSWENAMRACMAELPAAK